MMGAMAASAPHATDHAADQAGDPAIDEADDDRAARLSPDVRSPFLANAAVVVGFGLIFTTFMTDSAWSWVLGGLLVLAGGLWAGFSGGRATGDPTGVSAHEAVEVPAGAEDGPPAVEGARAVREGAEPPAEPASGRVEQDHGRTG
jgi:hypothetical protein